jgi:regulator of protease activity HflC (stomatin/prohibitin superfamily)
MALFGVDSWNVLLDQALNGAIRNFLKSTMTLDDVLGETPKDIWEKNKAPVIDFDVIAHGIRDRLDAYTIELKGEKGKKKMTLLELGLDIQRVEIVDFVDELPAAERARFFAAVIGREEGRAIHLRGQGTAKAEAELLAAHKDGGEVSELIIKHRALVDAAKGSDILGALAAGFARKQIGDK